MKNQVILYRGFTIIITITVIILSLLYVQSVTQMYIDRINSDVNFLSNSYNLNTQYINKYFVTRKIYTVYLNHKNEIIYSNLNNDTIFDYNVLYKGTFSFLENYKEYYIYNIQNKNYYVLVEQIDNQTLYILFDKWYYDYTLIRINFWPSLFSIVVTILIWLIYSLIIKRIKLNKYYEELINTAFNNLEDIVLIIDEKNKLLYSNNNYKKYFNSIEDLLIAINESDEILYLNQDNQSALEINSYTFNYEGNNKVIIIRDRTKINEKALRIDFVVEETLNTMKKMLKEKQTMLS